MKHIDNIHEVVKKLIGPINPVGETHTDDERFQNLVQITELVDKLLTDIDAVAINHQNSHEFSRKQAGEFARKFFDKIGISA